MLLLLTASISGWCCLAMSMSQHQRQLHTKPLSTGQRRGLKWFAYGILLVALYPAVFTYGNSVGIALWLMCIGVVAWLPVMLLTYVSRRSFQGVFVISTALTLILVVVSLLS